MSYEVRVHPSAGAFLERAEGWLLRHEDRNNLVLSLAYGRAALSSEDSSELSDRLGASLFGTIEHTGEVVGCVIRTPPHKVLVTEMPVAAAPVLAGTLAVAYRRIPAVLGPAATAEAVAAEWVRLRGGGWAPGMEQRIHRLDEVVSPPHVDGAMRLARPDDLELGVEWGEGFARDAGVQFATSRETVAVWIAREALHFWEVDAVPVSIAVAQGRTPRGIRIGYVYTPPEHRQNGYASALVASLSRKMLDGGVAFCVLYTDVANPTSNAIYRRVGYEPLEDVRDVNVVSQEEL